MDEQIAKRPNPFIRFLAFLATAALVLGAVFLVANWQKLNFDSIRRAFLYRSLQRNESGQVESFSYGSGLNSSFLQVEDDLLICSSGGIQLYSPGGNCYVDQRCTLAHPILGAGGGAGLVYDAGGTDLYVYKNRALVFTLPVEQGHTILSASLSAQGLLTVVTQASGVKGSATVYDSNFERLFSVNLSSRFITDAILSPDGSTLALATAGQSGGIYDSQIALYSLEHPTEDDTANAVCSLDDDVILKLNWTDGPLRVLGESALFFVNSDGTLAGSYSYGGRYLKGYSIAGGDFATLLLGRYRASSSSDLVAVDTAGQERAILPLDSQVLSLSSAGRYLSVLTADELTIYNSTLEPYHTLTDLQGARKVLQRQDGSVTLISSESARLYLPD